MIGTVSHSGCWPPQIHPSQRGQMNGETEPISFRLSTSGLDRKYSQKWKISRQMKFANEVLGSSSNSSNSISAKRNITRRLNEMSSSRGLSMLVISLCFLIFLADFSTNPSSCLQTPASKQTVDTGTRTKENAIFISTTTTTSTSTTTGPKRSAQYSNSSYEETQTELEPMPFPSASIFSSILGGSSSGNGNGNGNNNNDNSNSVQQQQDQGSSANTKIGQQTAPSTSSTAKDKVTFDGDVLLGGLFPIHMKGK